jgi:asparagine synthase (glutamine-hydrolysing)
MCGIAGFISPQIDTSEREQIAQKICRTLSHRGPDSFGISHLSSGVTFIHTRLSILDLSPAGHQPMVSSSRRYTVTFNGEIYNFQDLKRQLAQKTFRGSSDTEVMLECIEEFGFEETLKKISGMFSLAVWDDKEKVLYLARDRFGEKPCYYGVVNNKFLFGSELKAIMANSDMDKTVDLSSLALYLKHNYIPSPHSIFKNIKKLPQATFIKVNPSAMQVSEPISYWSLSDEIEKPHAHELLDDEEVLDNFERLLKKTISAQMQSDVPLGCFLSGGVDSSLIAAIMQNVSDNPIQTFTIGFNEEVYDESNHAKRIANYLGTQHREWIISPNEVKDVIPMIPQIYDEPFSDSSQLPTYLLSKLTKKHVTVSLSGDGGDELFGGYSRYIWLQVLWNKISLLPSPMRTVAAAILNSIREKHWNNFYEVINTFIPVKYKTHNFGNKVYKGIAFLKAKSPFEVYDNLISHWQNPNIILQNNADFENISERKIPKSISLLGQMMYMDSQSYLPDDIMVKVDRASMAVSLETRSPFLDHKLAEYVWGLPDKFRVRNGESKWLLRQVLYKHVPREYVERPKQGFGVPLEDWFRGELRNMLHDYLSDSRISRQGLFNSKKISRLLKEHDSGKKNWHYQLWDILVFQMWYEKWEN